jgi:hypothetical protein
MHIFTIQYKNNSVILYGARFQKHHRIIGVYLKQMSKVVFGRQRKKILFQFVYIYSTILVLIHFIKYTTECQTLFLVDEGISWTLNREEWSILLLES